MVGVAQLVEHGIVTPVVVGSIPIVHPIFRKAPDLTVWRLFCFSGLSGGGSRATRAGRFVEFMFLDAATLLAAFAGSGDGQGIGRRLLLYMEGLSQSPGVRGCICCRGGVHWCALPSKLPAVFLPVFSRVTS